MQLLYFNVVFNEIKKINIFIIFYQQNLKEEDFKCFEGKLMQKLEEKVESLSWQWEAKPL